MPAKVKVDQYANRAFISITMSAANTLTFEQIRFGVGLFQGIALVLHRIEWHPGVASLQEVVAAADIMKLAVTNRDDLTSIAAQSQNVLVRKVLSIRLVGAIVSMLSDEIPYVSDFSDLPGGGLIIPPNPLFLAMDTAGFAAAGTLEVVMYYTFKALSDADYLELIQSLIPANI